MKEELLKELGLNQETIDTIMAEANKGAEGHEQRIKTLETDKENLVRQLDNANMQIKDFEGMDVEGIKKAAKEYKTKFEAAEAEGKAKLEKLQFDHALSAALTGAKARDARAVTALLEMDGLKFNNGEVTGLEGQLEKLKAEKGFLFESDESVPKIVRGAAGTPAGAGNAAIRAIMGLPEKKS